MVSKGCSQYQEDLMDIYYGELEWDVKTKEHLLNCEECNGYWEQLMEMKKTLEITSEEPINYSEIRNVMEKAEEIQQKNSLKDLFIFIILASGFLFTIASLVFKGYGRSILYLQGILHLALPLSLPFLLKRRLLKEELDEH